MSNTKLNLQDPRFELRGDKSQCPRYMTAVIFGGYSDCVGLVEKTPGGVLYRINDDGSVEADDMGNTFDAYLAASSPHVEQVSGLLIAALIHERTGAK